MALIKCPECGKEISEYAVQCGYCFYPLRERTALTSADALNSVSLPKLRIRNGKTDQKCEWCRLNHSHERESAQTLPGYRDSRMGI